MRTEPTSRIPLGILALLAALVAYALLIARNVAPLIAGWNGLFQLPVYVVLGSIWLLPMRRYLKWMETGKWR